jgi:hypothetical protein
MEKMKNYYRELPQGFGVDYVIDAKKKSTVVVMNISSVLIMIFVASICLLFKFYDCDFSKIDLSYSLKTIIALIVFIVSIIAYLVVHELTHGLVYKLMTRQKLTFGLTLSVAYCGIKEGYVNKKTAILAILAPFVIHSIWMIVAICLLADYLYAFLMIILFAIHFGGCVGDLYGSFILIFKYSGKQVLMNDNGPKQTFYIDKSAETTTLSDN